MDDFAQNLVDIIATPDLPPELVILAKATLRQWEQGITPSGSTLKALKKATAKPLPCSVETNGVCLWMRKYGKDFDLPVPPVGEPARCIFGPNMHKCPGYKS